MSRSADLFTQAQKHIPGGVNSPVRAFKSVGGTPLFFKHAEGAYVIDEDDQRYVDYVGSWGPMILGHSHPDVLDAVRQQLQHGLSYGAPTAMESEMADLVCSLVPSMEMVRMVSSGTEATMSAIRLARGFTGRDSIIKFEGCYHGHADSLLVKAGSGLATFGAPTSAGVPQEVVQHTLVLEYNNVAHLEEAFALHGKDVACLIIEPIAGNMNFIRPTAAFVQACRQLCTKHGALLIIDEVMTGFRVALGGAQAVLGVDADITVMGKVIGGGMPLAAFGGKRAVMEHISPLGDVYQAGTLSGNPVATACGLATLKEIQRPGFYQNLSATTRSLMQGLQRAADAAGVPFCFDCEGGMFGFFLLPSLPQNYQQVMQTDSARFNRLFHALLDGGVYIAPALYEAGFVSAAHSQADIEQTLAVAEQAFLALA